MPETRLVKAKLVETKQNKRRTAPSLKARDAGQRDKTQRASSCPRCRCDTANRSAETSPEAVPKPANHQRSRAAREQTRPDIHSHKAFTVFAPNPKKRLDIQQKAAAELAALDNLRLSRAMGYISLSPRTVGGCLTLEEARARQQRAMLTTQRHQQVKRYMLLQSPVSPK